MNTNTTNISDNAFFDQLIADAPKEYREDRFPMFHVDEHGDCFELLLSAEPYNGERTDGRVTIYRGIESNQMVGVLVKGLKTWIARVLDNFPGINLDLQDHAVQLELLFQIEQYQTKDPNLQLQYKTLRNAAGDWSFTLHDISEQKSTMPRTPCTAG